MYFCLKVSYKKPTHCGLQIHNFHRVFQTGSLDRQIHQPRIHCWMVWILEVKAHFLKRNYHSIRSYAESYFDSHLWTCYYFRKKGLIPFKHSSKFNVFWCKWNMKKIRKLQQRLFVKQSVRDIDRRGCNCFLPCAQAGGIKLYTD